MPEGAKSPGGKPVPSPEEMAGFLAERHERNCLIGCAPLLWTLVLGITLPISLRSVPPFIRLGPYEILACFGGAAALLYLLLKWVLVKPIREVAWGLAYATNPEDQKTAALIRQGGSMADLLGASTGVKLAFEFIASMAEAPHVQRLSNLHRRLSSAPGGISALFFFALVAGAFLAFFAVRLLHLEPAGTA